VLAAREKIKKEKAAAKERAEYEQRLRNEDMESKKKHALEKGGTEMGLSDDLLAARKHAAEESQRKKMEGSKQLASENAAHRQAIKW